MVDATVVAPHWLLSFLFGLSSWILLIFFCLARTNGRSLVEHLSALCSTPEIAKSCNSSDVNPTLQYPSLTAMVAGMAPLFLIMDDKSLAS